MNRFLAAFGMILLLLSCSHEEQQERQTVSPERSDLDILLEQTAKNPKDADAWYHIADLYERVNAYEQEIEALQKVVALQPERGYAYFRMGNAYSRLAKYQEAVKAFEKAKSEQAKNPVLFNNMAIALGKLNRPNDEIAALRAAIKIRPRYSAAHFNLAMVYLRTGNRQGALREQQTLMEFDVTLANTLKKEIEKKR